MCNVSEDFKDHTITTPIAISNHTNWFDIFYIAMGNAPLSYVAKAEVKHWPFIGTIASSRKCVYVDRDT
jgi:1-acyl-sn-glycerol-3-phosphate acyltransferase